MPPEPDSETDLPVTLRVELRVLYGPQAGSRLALAEGEYLLGSADVCTIILAGPKIEEEHAILNLDGDEITIQPLDGEVCDAQGNEFTDAMPLALGQAVELGGIWIAVDDPDAAWPDLQTIAPPPGQAPVLRDDTTDGMEQPDEEEGAEPDATLPEPSPEPVTAAEPDPDLLQEANAGGWRRRLNKLKWKSAPVLVGGTLVLVVLLLVVAWLVTDEDDERRAAVIAAVTQPVLRQPRPVPPAVITEYLKSLPYGKELSVARDDAGDWRVSGSVRTNADRQELTVGLAALDPPAVAHVSVDDDLAAAANRYLAGRPAGNAVVRAEAIGGGGLRLVGAATDAAAVEALQRELRNNVPGIRRFESQLAMPQQLRERLRARIAEAGLDKRLIYVQEAPDVVLTGRLNSEETARWEALLVQFAREYGNLVPIRASISSGSSNAVGVASSPATATEAGQGSQRLPVAVQAIVSGPVPYIVTRDGTRINQGGEIDGQTLVSVKDGEVVFEGKRRIRIVR